VGEIKMEIFVAKNILTQLKKQIRQREVYEALDIAIEALAWKELDKGFESQPSIEYNSNKEKNDSAQNT
jgi:hypothetical protein